MTDPDIQQAEKNFVIQLLTMATKIVTDARILAATVALLVGWVTYISNHQYTPAAQMAVSTDPCYVKGKDVNNANQQACIGIVCTILGGCHQVPPAPTPTPVPVVVDAGPPSPVIIGGGQLPGCNPQAFKASPDEIKKRRATIHRRVLIPNMQKLISPSIPKLLGATYPTIAWPFNNPFCGDQGQIGMCVSAAANDVSVTQPFTVSFGDANALNASFLTGYEWITANDSIPGQYPPNDTGSDTLTGCKWLVHMGYAKSCNVLSGKAQIISALESGSIMSGIDWPSTAFETDACGHLDMSGVIEGGHDREIFAYDSTTDEFVEQNSWGQSFGVCVGTHCGLQRMKASDELSARLQADFVQPVR